MKPQIVESGSVVIGPIFRPKDARCGEKRFTWSVCTSLPGRRVPHSTFSSVKSNFKCGFLHFLALTFHTELISLSGSFSICSSICLLSSILLLLINPLIPQFSTLYQIIKIAKLQGKCSTGSLADWLTDCKRKHRGSDLELRWNGWTWQYILTSLKGLSINIRYTPIHFNYYTFIVHI